jgi:S-DNA-T family DNA segregation ATPase FtsK/SpoIIIE
MPSTRSKDSLRTPAARRPRSSVAATSSGRESGRSSGSSPHRKYDLTAIGWIAFGLLTLVSLARAGAGGALGDLLARALRCVFGSGAWISPFLFIALGICYALDRKRRPPIDVMIGTCSLFLIFLTWRHLQSLRLSGANAAAPDSSQYGGIVGAGLGHLLLSGFGGVGGYIFLIAMIVASLLLITDAPLARTLGRYSRKSADKARRAKTKINELRRKKREEAFPEDEKEFRPAPRALNGKKKAALAWPPNRLWPEESANASESESQPEAGEARPPAQETASEEEIVPARAVKRKTALGLSDASGEKEILPMPVPASPAAPKPKTKPSKRIVGTSDEEYVLPPLDLLNPPFPSSKLTQADREKNIEILEGTLSDFKIDAEVVEICHGPSVTRYEIRLAAGTYVKRIVNLADNIAMSLAAIAVRVEAPIPGKSAIGVEVPNRQPTPVGLRQILDTQEFMGSASPLTIALGSDVANQPKYADIAKMPHLLVGGSTNSGKSVCLNAIICSLLYRNTPEDLKLLLIDPKRVELSLYDGIPHLVYPVVKDVRQAGGVLRWAIKEMDRRYDLLVNVGARNIEGYNKKLPEGEKKLPYLVIVIDELADLMMQQGPEIEGSICRLAQLARAVGIHHIIATQRPSVDVITGTIKANISSRIAFAVASGVDSKTILDQTGAERLIGRGDMLFLPIDAPKAVRIQGAYVGEAEIEALVDHLKAQAAPDYVAEVVTADGPAMGKDAESDDELFENAVRLVVSTGHASTSMLQRKFNVGYGRAARLIDMMEGKGIVGPMNNAKPREILIPREAVDQMFTGLGKADAMPFDEDE